MCDQRNTPAFEACQVVENHRLAATIGRLLLAAPRTAERAMPGQFVHLYLEGLDGCVLRRPFCIYRIDASHGHLELVYQVVGIGTSFMADLTPGAPLDLIGPVGRGWTLDSPAHKALLVAGGIGAAPLYQLASYLLPDTEVQMVMGAQNASLLAFWADYEALLGAGNLHICTDDGSAGHHGFVTDVLAPLLADNSFDYLACCGPHAMLRAVARQARAAGISCEVSLEERMACGIGACLSCVVDTVQGSKRICVDGPVFRADEVIWNA